MFKPCGAWQNQGAKAERGDGFKLGASHSCGLIAPIGCRVESWVTLMSGVSLAFLSNGSPVHVQLLWLHPYAAHRSGLTTRESTSPPHNEG